MEHDQTKQLTCYVSFDPALDIVGMGYTEPSGGDYNRHFGKPGGFGSRDPRLVKVLPGKRATTFVLRPLRAFERVQCDSLPTAEARWLHALAYTLVRAELSPPLATEATATFPPAHGQPLDDLALDYLAERVGVAALYEMGAVAYNRSKLGPFGVAFAPLPLTSAHALALSLQYLADTQEAEASRTPTTGAASTSPASNPTAPATSETPGDATAVEPSAGPSTSPL